jgi:hypothetical protein
MGDLRERPIYQTACAEQAAVRSGCPKFITTKDTKLHEGVNLRYFLRATSCPWRLPIYLRAVNSASFQRWLSMAQQTLALHFFSRRGAQTA